jgi:hypothetical protein
MSGKFECELLDEERDIEFSLVVHWALDEGWEGDRTWRYVEDAQITSARVLCGSIPNRLAWVHTQPARKGLWLTVNDVDKIDVPQFLETYRDRLAELLVEFGPEVAHV